MFAFIKTFDRHIYADSGEAARGFRDDPARGCGGLLACGFLTPDWREGQARGRVRRHYELSKRLLAAVAAPVGLWATPFLASSTNPQDSAPMVAHERALGTAATEAAAGSALRLMRRLSPVSSMWWALWTRRSRMASA